MEAKELLQEAPVELLESSFSSEQWKQKGCSSDSDFGQGQEKGYLMWYVWSCLVWRSRSSSAHVIVGCMELSNSVFITGMLIGTI